MLSIVHDRAWLGVAVAAVLRESCVLLASRASTWMGQVRQYPSETAFAPLVDDKDYTISLSSYIFYGGDGYDMLASGVRCIWLTHSCAR